MISQTGCGFIILLPPHYFKDMIIYGTFGNETQGEEELESTQNTSIALQLQDFLPVPPKPQSNSTVPREYSSLGVHQ